MDKKIENEIRNKCDAFIESICREYSGYVTESDINLMTGQSIMRFIASHKVIKEDGRMIWIYDPELTEELKKRSVPA